MISYLSGCSICAWFAERSWFWWVNEVGIVFEIVGATIIVIAAFHGRARIKHIEDTRDADLSVKLRDIIASQAFTELKGLGLLALGLIGQMIGGLND